MSIFVFFWKPDEENGIFGNWFPSQFVVNNTTYSCVEQHLMHRKACLFQDDATADAIMATTDPRMHKKLGRQVKNFSNDVWNTHKDKILYEGLMCKFSQNLQFKQILLATGDKTLVEASPLDKIYGIGIDRKHPDATNPSQWRGQNLLGNTLMEVRRDLQG